MAVPAINSRFDVLGSRSARALLRISQRLGVLIGLSHRGGGQVAQMAEASMSGLKDQSYGQALLASSS